MVWQPGSFDVEERLRDLLAKGDDLERIAMLVDFGMFRAELERAVPHADGWPAFYDSLLRRGALVRSQGR